MDWIMAIGIFLVVYSVLCFLVAFAKPKWVWETGKLRGFVELIGVTGTVIMLAVIGTVTLVSGLLILL